MPQFDDKSARRISKAVRGWERRQQGRQSQRGRWHFHGGSGASGDYWCMLMEDHPGLDKCFKIIVGEWNPATNGWDFDCETPENEWETGVDFHNGVPYPDEFACGWFQRQPSDTTASGYIYVVKSLDCTSRGECDNISATGCDEGSGSGS